jgi:rRNA-processing protein FCF1
MHEESAQEASEPRLILVDTNCFLKLYQSPIRPFLGRVIGSHRLVTMNAMVNEFMRSERLQDIYAWLSSQIGADLKLEGAILELNDEQAKTVKENFDSHGSYASTLLEEYCAQEKTQLKRSLSRSDLELLATAISLETLVATDEWPLKLVIDDLASAPEEGYNLGAINSVEVLGLFEKHGAISAEQRKQIVRSWLQYGEILPRDWRDVYQELFGEPGPVL